MKPKTRVTGPHGVFSVLVALSLPSATLFLGSSGTLFAADFSWDGEPASANAQYGPASGSVWDSTTVTWIPGNTVNGNATATWINATDSIAQFKSGTGGTAPTTLTLTLGEAITAQKIDLGGSFNTNLFITDGGNAAYTLTLAELAPNTSPTAFTHTIDAVIIGSSGLSKFNAGAAVFTKANTYTGGTAISLGILEAQNAQSFSTEAVNVTGGGQARLNGVTVANDFILGGIGLGEGTGTNTNGAIRFLDGGAISGEVTVTNPNGAVVTATMTNGTISGNILLTGGDLILNAGTMNLTGPISGGHGLRMAGGGTGNIGSGATDTTANTYTGTTTISSGTLHLNKAAGTTAIAGDITLTGGALNWSGGRGNQIADTTTITMNGGGSITATPTETFKSLIINVSGTQGTFNPGSGANLTVTDAFRITGNLEKLGTGNQNNYSLGTGSNHTTLNVGTRMSLDNAYFAIGQANASDFTATLNLQGDFQGTGETWLVTGVSSGTGQRLFVLSGAGAHSHEFNIEGSSSVTTFDTAVAISETSGTTGSIRKTGEGTLILRGANTYTGSTVIEEGTVALGASGSIASSSTIDIREGAVLDVSSQSSWAVATGQTITGTGSIIGTVASSGIDSIFAPGASPGTLTFNGNLDLSAGATFNFELGTDSDLIVVGGTLTGSDAENALVFHFSDAGGLAVQTAYTLFEFGDSAGLDYGDLFAGTLPSGLTLDEDFGTGGWLIEGDRLLVRFVPEPSASLLSGLGLLLAFRRRRI